MRSSSRNERGSWEADRQFRPKGDSIMELIVITEKASAQKIPLAQSTIDADPYWRDESLRGDGISDTNYNNNYL